MKKKISLALKCIIGVGLILAVVSFTCRLKYPAVALEMPNPAEQLGAREAKEEFNVVVFSDIACNYKTMDTELKAVNATNADFAICNGDLVKYDSSEIRFSYVQRKLMRIIKMPLFIVPGNHDGHPDVGYQRYRAFFGRERYHWSYSDTLFVAVNTGKEDFDESEQHFLRKTLEQERAKYRRCVLVMHCPPVDLRPNNKTHCLENKKEIEVLECLVKEHRIDMIVTSHVHCYLEGRFAGVPIFHTQSGGQHVRDKANPNIGYVLMSFKKDGDIQLKRVDVTSIRGRGVTYVGLVMSENFLVIASVCLSAICFALFLLLKIPLWKNVTNTPGCDRLAEEDFLLDISGNAD